jgi:hypothetical protein
MHFGNRDFISALLFRIGFFEKKYAEPGSITAHPVNRWGDISIVPCQPLICTFQQGLRPFGKTLTKLGQNFIGQVVVGDFTLEAWLGEFRF